MQPGQLDRRLVVLRRTVTKDSAGAPVETWAEQFRLWAGRETVTGSVQVVANSDRDARGERMRIRFIQCLECESSTGDYRIVFNGRKYDLLSGVEDLRKGLGRRAWMVLTMAAIQGEPTLTTETVPVA